ncbi:MAG: hypothetical protein ABW022_08475 [Actinoplanes sp.]
MTDTGLDPIAFSFAWLAGNADQQPTIAACTAGHMVVRSNTHWQPEAFTDRMQSLRCRAVHCDAPPAGTDA